MKLPLAAVVLALGLLLAPRAWGDEPPAKDAPQDAPAKEPPAKEPPGEDGKTKDTKTKGAKAKAPDLVAPTPELAALLAPYEDEAEPTRELKRACVAILHYLFSRDLERLLPYFHPQLRMHVGQGEFQTIGPAELRRLMESQLAIEEAEEAPPRLSAALVKGSLRVYSRARAEEVDAEAEGWREIAPARVARWMEDGDWLVLARLEHPALPSEVFYVFRRDGERFKAVLSD